jgi:hypothetical protein
MNNTDKLILPALNLSDQQAMDRALAAHGLSVSRSWMTSRDFRRRAERQQPRLRREQGNSLSKGF